FISRKQATSDLSDPRGTPSFVRDLSVRGAVPRAVWRDVLAGTRRCFTFTQPSPPAARPCPRPWPRTPRRTRPGPPPRTPAPRGRGGSQARWRAVRESGSAEDFAAALPRGDGLI